MRAIPRCSRQIITCGCRLPKHWPRELKSQLVLIGRNLEHEPLRTQWRDFVTRGAAASLDEVADYKYSGRKDAGISRQTDNERIKP